KLMTAYVTFEAVRDGRLKMTSPVKISPQARSQPPSKMGFALGTIITVETALRLILTKSANDVSVALAEAVAGTESRFVARMNTTAAALGMVSTHYENPHGLPNRGQVTTARDIGVLMLALQEDFPQFADFFTMSGVKLGRRTIRNYNVLIRRFQGADGMKTGFICSAGFNIAASATRDGRRLGVVVLGGLTGRERNHRTAELLAKGFQAAEGGGVVALDGFGTEDRLALAPVTGTRPDQGTVVAMVPEEEGPGTPVDLRPIVCGNERPVTRYADGVVGSEAAILSQRNALDAWESTTAKARLARQVALNAPRQVPGTAVADTSAPSSEPLANPEAVLAENPASPAKEASAAAAGDDQILSFAPARALADEALRPAAWQTTAPKALPLPDPRTTKAPQSLKPGQRSDFAPEDWIPSQALPQTNPFVTAGVPREPLPERPILQPLTYLEPARVIAPIAIKVGGADATRPDPLSGTVVGGGPAPKPTPKPEIPIAAVFAEEADPTDVLEHAAAVRESVEESE
ncbi:MAG: serine hydrolase, partial [Pseudomonadota bacterium]